MKIKFLIAIYLIVLLIISLLSGIVPSGGPMGMQVAWNHLKLKIDKSKF